MILGWVFFDCGHRCCTIRTNPWHRHTHPPQICPLCRDIEREEDTP